MDVLTRNNHMSLIHKKDKEPLATCSHKERRQNDDKVTNETVTRNGVKMMKRVTFETVTRHGIKIQEKQQRSEQETTVELPIVHVTKKSADRNIFTKIKQNYEIND